MLDKNNTTFEFSEGQNSVKLSKTTKGYTWEIKVYGETIMDCVKNAQDADQKFRKYAANPDNMVIE